MKVLALVLLAAACAHSYSLQHAFKSDSAWQFWKATNKCSYKHDGEESVRYMIWQDNVRYITEHNARTDVSYTLKINEFADLTNAEYREKNGWKMPSRNRTTTESKFLVPCGVELPAEVDWRKQGYVTPVKNQGQCGSCWAFSTTGSLEGQMYKKTGVLTSLSEQQLLDCSTSFGNHGCNGGLMDNAFDYIKSNGGLDSEAAYPYETRQSYCRYKQADSVGTVTGYTDISTGDELELKQALATQGPVSVAIDASHQSFQFYDQGVYDEPACDSYQLDHGVLAVGYGTENGKDYWLVKNSWGTSWGEEGYIKMSRNCNNQCGIASCASYPLV
jgi:cathepsin L